MTQNEEFIKKKVKESEKKKLTKRRFELVINRESKKDLKPNPIERFSIVLKNFLNANPYFSISASS